MLQNCVEQPFDGPSAPVVRNAHFQEEFFYNIKAMFQNIEPRLGMNTNEHKNERRKNE